uniref:Putative secreted protein n=1 Tax=Anopheles darlingi TaxID=43151 RepID=A0A2M4DBM2_ANODA
MMIMLRAVFCSHVLWELVATHTRELSVRMESDNRVRTSPETVSLISVRETQRKPCLVLLLLLLLVRVLEENLLHFSLSLSNTPWESTSSGGAARGENLRSKTVMTTNAMYDCG